MVMHLWNAVWRLRLNVEFQKLMNAEVYIYNLLAFRPQIEQCVNASGASLKRVLFIPQYMKSPLRYCLLYTQQDLPVQCTKNVLRDAFEE